MKLLAKAVMFTSAALLLTACEGMQPLPESELTITKVYDVPGVSKDQIFSRSKQWVSENFRSAPAVTDHESQQEGLIIIKGTDPFWGVESDYRLGFIMRIDMKEERLRTQFTDLRIISKATLTAGHYSPQYAIPVTREGEMKEAKPAIESMSESLYQRVKQPNADW